MERKKTRGGGGGKLLFPTGVLSSRKSAMPRQKRGEEEEWATRRKGRIISARGGRGKTNPIRWECEHPGEENGEGKKRNTDTEI